MRKTLLGGVSPFAHLLAGRAAKRAEEDTDDEKEKRENEKAKKAEAEKEEDAKSEAEEERKKDARKAEEDGDEEDEEDEEDADAKAIRGRERARCAAIFASPAAAVRPDMAAYFAFGTNLTRKAAVNALAAVAAGSEPVRPSRPGLGQRMSVAPQPNPGQDRPQAGSPSLAEQIVAAGKKRRGEA